ncbi:MAG: metallophosphoesterase family protein [Pseudomonadales bacterium]
MIGPDLLEQLSARVGAVHARQRLGIEAEHETEVLHRARPGRRSMLHPENWYSLHRLIEFSFQVSLLHRRARRNARQVAVTGNRVALRHLPQSFDGYRVLHLSDLHMDVSQQTADAIIEAVRTVDYDLCVLTGDYRFRTSGDPAPTLRQMARLREALQGDVFAVLGNHDSLAMLPALESMGYRLLMNEHVAIAGTDASIYLGGIDDAHYYGVDNLHGALDGVPADAVILLLSHTPEVYRKAAHASVDLMLCGHTHGGQVCLPGGRPIIVDAQVPRRIARGAWRHQDMVGYTSRGAGTSIVEVRLNCPAEITLHTLVRAG